MSEQYVEPAPEELNPTPGVTISLDVKQFMSAYYDAYDDEYTYRDRVTAAVADRIRDEISKDVREAVKEVVREQVADIVKETLTAGVQLTNGFGEGTGPATTLRDMIAKQATDWMKKPSTSRYSDNNQDKNTLDYYLKTEVSRALSGDLNKTLDEARKALKAKIATEGAALLTETIKRATL